MTVNDTSPACGDSPTARDVCQILREVVFGRLLMTMISTQRWDEVYACRSVIDIDGWRITLYHDSEKLDYCKEAVSPDGLRWGFDTGDRYGTDPVALLSTWEHQTLERMLKEL